VQLLSGIKWFLCPPIPDQFDAKKQTPTSNIANFGVVAQCITQCCVQPLGQNSSERLRQKEVPNARIGRR
jgi:hypothetical protein